MKKILIIFVVLMLARTGWTQQLVEEEKYLPLYVQGAGTFNAADDRKVPYACRLTIEDLTPNATYRYYSRFELATGGSAGSGNYLVVKESGFARKTSAIFVASTGNFGEFTTNSLGSYTGWFVIEPTSGSHYAPGTQLQVFIVLNNGAGGSTPVHRLRTTSIIKVINFGPDSDKGTAVWSTAAGGTPRNFVMLYDHESGTGRPVAGTLIEDAGPLSDLSLANGYADFYADNVNGVDKTWGTIIPNNLSGGIKRISQYNLSTGAEVASNTSVDGKWLTITGETVSTANATGGLTSPIALDGYEAALYPPRIPQTVNIISPVPAEVAIGDAGFTLSASATSGLTDFEYTAFPSGVLSISGNTVTGAGVGTAVIKARQVGSAVYEPASVTSSVITVKKKQNITLVDVPSKTYGDDVFTLDVSSDNTTIPVTVSSSDPAIAEVFYETLESRWKVLIHGAGNVQLTASQASNAEYQEASVSKPFSVQKKTLTITADNKSKVVNTPNPILTATYEGFIAGEDETDLAMPAVLNTVADGSSPVGDYAITVSGAASPNYDITFVNGTLAVVNKLQTITFPAISNRTYGAEIFDPGAVSNTGITPIYASSNTAVAVIENNQVQIKGTGQVRITATFAATGDYPLTTAERSFSVLKKPLTITADDKTRTYGKDNPQLTVSYTGFVYDETADVFSTKPVLSTSAERSSPVSTYTITVTGATAVNYDITYVYGTLTIARAPLTITAESKSKVQGEPNPPLTANYEGFVNGETPAVLTSLPTLYTAVEASSLVGDYPITVSGASAGNYAITYVDGTMAVKQRTRTLTFNALVPRLYGDADFDAGAVLSSGETVAYTSSNSNVATVTDGKIHIVSAGVTNITATAPANANYENTPVRMQTLVVNRAPQYISFAEIPQLNEGSGHELVVGSSSGLEVTLSIDNRTIVSLEGNRIIPHQAGVTRITATQPGNANYLPAEAYVREVRVADADGTFIAVHQALSINGDGVNESLVIDGIENYQENYFTIVNRNGVKVFEVNNYDNHSNAFQGRGNTTYYGNLPQGTYFYVLEYRDGRERKRKTGYFVLKY